MVSKGRLAAAAQVSTPDGPVLAGRLRPGMEAWTVSTTGRLIASEILACEPVAAPVDVARVLTRAGEILAPAGAQLAGAWWPVAASTLSSGPRTLELVAPGDLPPANGKPLPLDGLGSVTAVIPEEVADPPGLRAALRRAGVEHLITEAGGWVAVKLGHVDGAPDDWGWDDERELLLALTAWTPEEGGAVHRTRLGDRMLRARLVGVLLACGQYFEVRWVPGYWPVEARISLTDAAPPPYTAVVAVQHTTGDAVDITMPDAAAIVADLAYLRLRQVMH